MKSEEEKLIDQLKVNLKFRRQLYFLWIKYSNILEILDNFGGMLAPSGDLRINYYYTILLRDVRKILEEKGFEDLKKDAPKLYENLEGDTGEIELLGKEAHKFFAKLEKIKNAVEDYAGKIAKGWQEVEKENGAKQEAQIAKVEAINVQDSLTKDGGEKVILVKSKTIESREEPLFPTLKNTSWQDITIKFKNEFDVEVIIRGKPRPSNYEKMGFADGRVKNQKVRAKANGGWELLFLLSIEDGNFSFSQLVRKEKVKRGKQKESLSKNLRKLFSMIEDDDPFYDYNDIDGMYKIKIKLIPIELFRPDFRDKDIRDDSDEDRDRRGYYDKLTGKE